MTGAASTLHAGEAAPPLSFAVQGAAVHERSASPAIALDLHVTAPEGLAIRSLLLTVQVRAAFARRAWDPETRERLASVLGPASAGPARSLVWTQATVVVPPFTGSAHADVVLPCTYDFDVALARCLDALPGGALPLDLLFSGTIFLADAGGRLRVTRVSHDTDARFDLPVSLWRAAMDRWFPGTAWMRVSRETFDRLAAVRTERALLSWDDTLSMLFDEAEGR
jgi:Family of unknown function (DUF6084)